MFRVSRSEGFVVRLCMLLRLRRGEKVSCLDGHLTTFVPRKPSAQSIHLSTMFTRNPISLRLLKCTKAWRYSESSLLEYVISSLFDIEH